MMKPYWRCPYCGSVIGYLGWFFEWLFGAHDCPTRECRFERNIKKEDEIAE